jgi:hypothetical protein
VLCGNVYRPIRRSGVSIILIPAIISDSGTVPVTLTVNLNELDLKKILISELK